MGGGGGIIGGLLGGGSRPSAPAPVVVQQPVETATRTVTEANRDGTATVNEQKKRAAALAGGRQGTVLSGLGGVGAAPLSSNTKLGGS